MASDQAAMRAELNQVKLKLRDAGVQLDHYFKWRLGEVYWNPVGFDFLCDDPLRLQHVADKSKKLAIESIDMPGYDPWRQAGIRSVGFSHVGAPPRVHLDIAISQPGLGAYPGLCRVYIARHGEVLKRDAFGVGVSAFANDPIVRKVTRALCLLRLPLKQYGIHVTKVYKRPEPEGFDFDVDDPDGLLKAAAAIPALARDDTRRLEGKISAGVTLGTGYREVGYGPRIHLEVAQNGKGNVHIDLEGWVVGKDARGAAIYNWVHGISHHFPEDLLPGYVGRPLVGAWRGIEWRPSVGVEHGRGRDESKDGWRAHLGFVFNF